MTELRNRIATLTIDDEGHRNSELQQVLVAGYTALKWALPLQAADETLSALTGIIAPAAGPGMPEALLHAKARFECLAEDFGVLSDGVNKAMCEVDAERMQRALATPQPAAAQGEVAAIQALREVLKHAQAPNRDASQRLDRIEEACRKGLEGHANVAQGAMQPAALRETIARIIDPRAFDGWQGQYDWSKKSEGEEFAQRCADHFYLKEKDEALQKADAILGALSSHTEGERQSPILWCCHVRGPDDVFAAPDYETALAWSDAMNEINWRNERYPKPAGFQNPSSYDECLVKAAPAIWPHSPEAHAEDLPKSIAGFAPPSQHPSTQSPRQEG